MDPVCIWLCTKPVDNLSASKHWLDIGRRTIVSPFNTISLNPFTQTAQRRLRAKCWGSELAVLAGAVDVIASGAWRATLPHSKAGCSHGHPSIARLSWRNEACLWQADGIDGMGNEKLISRRRKEYL